MRLEDRCKDPRSILCLLPIEPSWLDRVGLQLGYVILLEKHNSLSTWQLLALKVSLRGNA